MARRKPANNAQKPTKEDVSASAKSKVVADETQQEAVTKKETVNLLFKATYYMRYFNHPKYGRVDDGDIFACDPDDAKYLLEKMSENFEKTDKAIVRGYQNKAVTSAKTK